MPELIDISPVISPRIAPFPGDVPFRRDVVMDIRQGDNLTLSSIATSVHVGAHADAPSHYAIDGQPIAERPLGLYYGPCQVVAVDVGPGERILPEHLSSDVTAARVLFCTGTFPDPNVWRDDFASLSPQLIEHLAARGVKLVGIDTPSIDPSDDRLLESHQAVARHDLAVLEGLCLSHVEPNLYTLVALPLRIEDADAAPVRAALIPNP